MDDEDPYPIHCPVCGGEYFVDARDVVTGLGEQPCDCVTPGEVDVNVAASSIVNQIGQRDRT